MYQDLLIEAENVGLTVKEVSFPSQIKGFHGLTLDKNIYIEKSLSNKEKYTTLLEEIMHAKFSAGDIVNKKDIASLKDELKARGKAYEKAIPIEKFIELFEKHITEKEDIEEFFNLDIDYIEKVVKHYKIKHGLCHQIDNYIIYFYPTLSVMKLF